MSVRKALNWYVRLWPKKITKAPYTHIVQIGDPVLRKKCEKLDASMMGSYDTRQLVSKLKSVMKKYELVGLSAPQIGVDKRIFVMEFTEDQLKTYSDVEIENSEMKASPMMTFINPVMKVINPKKVIHHEGCGSIRGFTAAVPRFKEIHMSGFNEDGKVVGVKLNGWLARIAQHELDHLDGRVYTDIMDSETLTCNCWRDVNVYQGKVKLLYYS